MSAALPGFWQNKPALTPERTALPATEGFFDNLSASFESERLQVTGARTNVFQRAYDPILERLRQADGVDRLNPMVGEMVDGASDPTALFDLRPEVIERKQAELWAAIEARRAEGDPLDGIPESRDAFERQVLGDTAATIQRAGDAQRRATTMGSIGGFLGGVAAQATDPVNLVTMPLGGAGGFAWRQILKSAVLDGIAGGGVEALTYGDRRKWLDELGVEGPSMAEAVLYGAVAGAGIPAAGRVAGKAAMPVLRRIADAVDRLPASKLVSLAQQVLPAAPSRIRAALLAAEAEAEARRVNPFEPDSPMGLREHEARLEDATAAIAAGEPLRQAETPRAPLRADAAIAEPAGLEQFDPATLEVDAARFQFKDGGDGKGVTAALRGVDTWRPERAGVALVWEAEDGRLFIADGHQRLGLARRIAEQDSTQRPRISAFRFREADGVSAAEMRVIAALKNIAEGSGTPVDAAKILREAPDRALDLPPASALVRQGRSLAKLSDKAFMMAVNGVVPPHFAAQVGRLVDDPELHAPILALLRETEPDNVGQAESIIRQAMASPKQTIEQTDLFGTEAFAKSLFKERARVLEAATKELRKNKQLFGVLEREASTIEGAGNRLDREANARRADLDAQIHELVQRLAYRAGPVAEALDRAATRVGTGEPAAAAARDVVEALRGAVEEGGGVGALLGDARHADDAAATVGEAVRRDAREQLTAFDDPVAGPGVTQQASFLEGEARERVAAADSATPVARASSELEQRAATAVDTAISTQRDVIGAVKHPEIGEIDFLWGDPGDAAAQFARGYGISHIIAKRTAEGIDGEAFVRTVLPQLLARGTVTRLVKDGEVRWQIDLPGARGSVAVSRTPDGRPFVLTMHPMRGKGSGGRGSLIPRTPYASDPSSFRSQVGADPNPDVSRSSATGKAAATDGASGNAPAPDPTTQATDAAPAASSLDDEGQLPLGPDQPVAVDLAQDGSGALGTRVMRLQEVLDEIEADRNFLDELDICMMGARR